MRPSSSEVATALYGTWRLALFDSNAMQYFDKSTGGFWKSFYAAVFWIPVSAALSYFAFPGSPGAEFNLVTKAAADTAYLFAFPFAIYGACLAMGWQKHFIPCIVAFNWTRVLHVFIAIPLVLAIMSVGSDITALDPQNADRASVPVGTVLLIMGIGLYIIALEVFIFSRGLSISIPAGIGMIFFELFFALVWLVATQIITTVASGITS